MLERREAAAKVAEKLFKAEAAIDAALARTAELVSALPSVRRRTRLAATIGQAAVEGAAKTVVALSEARASIVLTHDELAGAHRRIGLGRFAAGPIQEKGEDGIEPNSGVRVIEGGRPERLRKR